MVVGGWGTKRKIMQKGPQEVWGWEGGRNAQYSDY